MEVIEAVAVRVVVAAIVGGVTAASVEERVDVACGANGVEIDPDTSAENTDVGVAYGVWVG